MLYLNEPHLKGNEKKYLNEVIDSTWTYRGKFNERFEEKFATYCKQKRALTVPSGTVAVALMLEASGVKKVACPAYTCMSVAQAIHHAGVVPVFVDIEKKTLGISYKSFVSMYKKHKFDGVLINHMYGSIAQDTGKILEFSKRHKIRVFEDASEAHGATSTWGVAGSLGEGAAFSLRSEKMIGVGQGGVIVGTKELIDKCYYLANDGRPSNKVKYYITGYGYNLFMPNPLGAIALAQFEQLPKIINIKRKIARWYEKHLTSKSFNKVCSDRGSVNWLNVYMMSDNLYFHREDLITLLYEKGIETRPGFYPLNRLPPFRTERTDKTPMSDHVGRRLIAFPSSVNMKEEDVKYIVGVLDRTKIL